MFGTSYEVSYKGQNNDRKAILDLVEWFGWKKCLDIFRHMRNIRAWWRVSEPSEITIEALKAELFKSLNGACMAIEFGGVSGEPVRALFRKYFGEELVKEWCAS